MSKITKEEVLASRKCTRYRMDKFGLSTEFLTMGQYSKNRYVPRKELKIYLEQRFGKIGEEIKESIEIPEGVLIIIQSNKIVSFRLSLDWTDAEEAIFPEIKIVKELPDEKVFQEKDYQETIQSFENVKAKHTRMCALYKELCEKIENTPDEFTKDDMSLFLDAYKIAVDRNIISINHELMDSVAMELFKTNPKKFLSRLTKKLFTRKNSRTGYYATLF